MKMQYISGEARKPSIFVSSTCYDLKQIRQGKYGLMHWGQVHRENVEMIQHYRENSSIMNALDQLEQYCEEKKTAVNEKIQSERQQNTNRKKKQHQIEKGLHR